MRAILCDLDGTLNDMSEIRRYAYGPEVDYPKFHELAVDAPVNDWVADYTSMLQFIGGDFGGGFVFPTKDQQIIILTARNQIYRAETLQWLDDNDIDYDRVMMRGEHDLRGDVEVKRDMLETLLSSGYQITQAFEDHPGVAKMYLSYGIPTTIIPGFVEE